MSSKAFYFRPDQRELLVAVLTTCKIGLRTEDSLRLSEMASMACTFTKHRVDELIEYINGKSTAP